MPKQPTSLNSLSRDLFAPCADGQVLVKDSTEVSGVAPANNGAGGNPFDQDLNTDDLPQFAGLGIGTPGVVNQIVMDIVDVGNATMDVGGFNVNDGVNYSGLDPAKLTLGFVTLDNLGVAAGISSITRDGGDVALSTTTSGSILLTPADGNVQITGGLGIGTPGVAGALTVLGAVQISSILGDSIIAGDVVNTAQVTLAGYAVEIDGDTQVAIAANAAVPVYWVFAADGSLTAPGTVAASGYLVGANPGIDGTVTTASLVGKTLTFEKGIITGFA